MTGINEIDNLFLSSEEIPISVAINASLGIEKVSNSYSSMIRSHPKGLIRGVIEYLQGRQKGFQIQLQENI